MALLAALPEQRAAPGQRILRTVSRPRTRRAPASRFDSLVRHLGEYGLARPDTVPLFASLLSLEPDERFAPLGLSPVREREELFRALAEWVRAYSERRPVLFVIEDLHWVDASTLEFLAQFLAAGLRDRILTLLTFRPEFHTPWPASPTRPAWP